MQSTTTPALDYRGLYRGVLRARELAPVPIKKLSDLLRASLSEPCFIADLRVCASDAGSALGIVDSHVCDTPLGRKQEDLDLSGLASEEKNVLQVLAESYHEIVEAQSAISRLSNALYRMGEVTQEGTITLSSQMKGDIKRILAKLATLNDVFGIATPKDTFGKKPILHRDRTLGVEARLSTSVLIDGTRNDRPYLDVDKFIGEPRQRNVLVSEVARMVPFGTDVLAAQSAAGLSIATDVSTELGIPLTFIIKEKSKHSGWLAHWKPNGTFVLIEGLIEGINGITENARKIGESNNGKVSTIIVAYDKEDGKRLEYLNIPNTPTINIVRLLRPEDIAHNKS